MLLNIIINLNLFLNSNLKLGVYTHNGIERSKRIEYFVYFIILKALQYISFQHIQSIIVIARATIARVPLCINASRA